MAKRRQKRKIQQEPWWGKYIGAGVGAAVGVVLIVIPEPLTTGLGLLTVSGALATAGIRAVNAGTPKAE